MTNIQDRFNEILKKPPVNIEALIQLFNIELDKNAALSPGISGEIRKLENGRYKISVNKNDHYFRQRFTMAHELGHFLFHLDKIGDGTNDDIKYRSSEKGAFYNTVMQLKEEMEANKFAASVLMPEDLLINYAHTRMHPPQLAELAKQFQVSKAAMEIRLEGLSNKLKATHATP